MAKFARTSAGEGGEPKYPNPLQALQDLLAVRFLEKGESSWEGLRLDSSPAVPSRSSPNVAPGLSERVFAALSLSSPACTCQDRFSTKITQDSTAV